MTRNSDIIPQTRGCEGDPSRSRCVLSMLTRVTEIVGIVAGISLLAFGFFLIYDCPGLAGFDTRELTLGITFSAFGLSVFLFGLFGAVRKRAIRCVVISIILVGLALWRYNRKLWIDR